MIDLFWRRARAEARCIPVDFDLMEVLTRGNGLTRKELRLVNSEQELQSMFAKLQAMLERFSPGDGAGSLREPISLREQEAVLEVVERAVLGAAAQAASVFSPEWPTEPQPGSDPDSPERQPQPGSVSLDQSTELQRQLGPVSPERSTEPQPEPDPDSPERQRQPGSNSAELLDPDEFGADSPERQPDPDSPERQPGSNSAELLATEPLSLPVPQPALVPRGSVARFMRESSSGSSSTPVASAPRRESWKWSLWQSRGYNKVLYEKKHQANLQKWFKSYTVSVDDAARPLDHFLQDILVAGIDDREDDRVRLRPGLAAAGEMISSGPLRDDHWVADGVLPEDRDWGADPSAVAATPCTLYRDVLENG